MKKEELKNKIKKYITEEQLNLYDLKRHIIYDDNEFYLYLQDNEYDINFDDLGQFQKFWLQTKKFISSLNVDKTHLIKVFKEIEEEQE